MNCFQNTYLVNINFIKYLEPIIRKAARSKIKNTANQDQN